ncbi:hypothetical protein AB0F36_33735 [Streptomyces sp. NPDC029080]|uniref:hypothetical protein n=1 Tax=Streptomyces sp. NPDC029080 TaxID=3155017 RepID=UPI0033CC9B6B
MALTGPAVGLGLAGRSTPYGLGVLMGPWLLVWVCALLALTHGGPARNGVRLATVTLMVMVVLPSVSTLSEAATTAELLDTAALVALGAPVLVLLFLPRTTAWFDRGR